MIKVMAMIAAAGMAAAPAMAQHEHEQEHHRAHERAHAAAVEKMNASDNRYESIDVVVRDGDVRVWVDGEELDADDVKRTDHGEVMFRWDGEWRATGASSSPETPAPRRVMLGVVLGDVSEALAAQLGIDAEKAILIQRVVEGSAAERAGIKRFDILEGFADETGLTVERLRELLAQQSPGDEAQVVVLRGGEKKRLTVTFEETRTTPGGEFPRATPENRLNRGRVMTPAPPAPPAPRSRFFGRQLDDESRAKLETAMREAELRAQQAQEKAKRLTIELQEQLRPLREMEFDMKLDGEARAQFEEAMAQLQEALQAENLDFDFDVNFELEELPRLRFIELDDDGNATVRRGLDAKERDARERAVILEKRAREQERRVEELGQRLRENAGGLDGSADRLDRLEERMERLERLLERAIERMEPREQNQSRDGSHGA